MKKESKIVKAIKDPILCIKYPFLYPRNRFDGKHHAYKLSKQLGKLYRESIEEIHITGRLEKENKEFPFAIESDRINIILDKENKLLAITNGVDRTEYSIKHLLWNDDRFEILGMTFNYPNITIRVKTRDEKDTTNYGFTSYTVNLLLNKTKHKWYNLLNWVDEHILDRIFIIPKYTELDAMPQGWRKAFGLDMCKEIKQSLLKTGGRKALKAYRIDQIKEKFGSLSWYDHNSTKEIWNIIEKYEDLSYKTCINCGKPATCISTGWISPYCDDCIDKNRKYVPMTKDDAWDNALNYYWPKDKE